MSILIRLSPADVMSRRSAKILLQNIGNTDILIIDFLKVHKIGFGFADQLFRVFQDSNKYIEIVPINACIDVTNMINRTRGNKNVL
jgi:hypothetical protein